MRIIDASFLNELKAFASLPVVGLLRFVIETHEFYLTSNDTDLGWDGKLWRSRGFSWNNIDFGSAQIVTNMSFDIDDIDQMFLPVFMASEPEPYPIDFFLASLNDAYLVQATIVLFRGFIDGWKYNNSSVQVDASSLLNQWSRKTLRMYSGSCRWASFKGAECGYTGSQERCDRTYGECESYGNTANFGGYRWLPLLQNKKIPWGME